MQDVKAGLEKIRQAEADKVECDLPTTSTADLEKEAILTVGKLSTQDLSGPQYHSIVQSMFGITPLVRILEHCQDLTTRIKLM